MTHDKEFYLRLAAVYRLLAKENKHTALEKAYESVAGKPWPYGCSFDYDADYIAFAAEFVLALAGSKIKSSPPLPTPVSYFPVILAPASARPPKSAKQGAYTLALLTKKNAQHPYKEGIAVRGEWLYATDGQALAKIRDDRWQAFDGKLLTPDSFARIETGRTPSIINTAPPDYKSIIPQREQCECRQTCDLEKLLATVYGTWMLMRYFEAVVYLISLRLSAHNVLFTCYAQRLYELLRILRINGGSTIEVCFQSRPRSLIFFADNGNTGVIALVAKTPNYGVHSQPIDLTDYQVLPADSK